MVTTSRGPGRPPGRPPKSGSKDFNYKRGDLVFAKLPGYPHWPGRIIDKISKEKGFDVFFYGDHSTYIVPGERLYDYEVNLEKYGNSNKSRQSIQNRQIKHALEEISTDPDTYYNGALRALEYKESFQDQLKMVEDYIKEQEDKKTQIEQDHDINNNQL